MEIKKSDWHGLYGESWSGEVISDAISHPAKFSRALIRHIYKHAIEEGWLKEGSCVLDPFAGVALGALDAMRHGMNWVGVELEDRFCKMGGGYFCPGVTRFEWVKWQGRLGRNKQICPECQRGDGLEYEQNSGKTPYKEPHHYTGNIELWLERYGKHFPGWGTARLVQGDSRQLLGVIAGVDCAISSPPFAGSAMDQSGGDTPMAKGINADGTKRGGKSITTGYGSTPGNLGNLPAGEIDGVVSSPPFLAQSGGTNVTSKQGPLSDARLLRRHSAGNAATDAYGDDPKNLGNLPEGEYDAAIASPPFAESNPDGGWQLLGKYAEEGRLTVKQVKGDPNKSYPSWDKDRETPYAPSPDNLGNMKDDGFDAAISSPPYAGTEVAVDLKSGVDVEERKAKRAQGGWEGYNKQNPANLGSMNDEDETFWSAARKIAEQTYIALKPGGVAIWVTKAFIKKGERVDFPGQWRQMCEVVGFVTLHEHKAWVIENRGAQYDIFGNLIEQKVERKSFFRRLAEKKGSPRIDWEVVTCMQKPKSDQ